MTTRVVFPPPGLIPVRDPRVLGGVYFTRLSLMDYGGFPAGWRAIEFHPELAAWTIVRTWWWPVAAIWRRWSIASELFVRTLPKGRYA